MGWLAQISMKTRLVIVHPNFSNHRMILSEMVDAGWAHVYHLITKDIRTPQAWQNELAHLWDRECLILDGADWIDPHVLNDMLQKLLPQHFIVLFVENIPETLMQNPHIWEITQILPTDFSLLPDYRHTIQPVLELRTLSNHPSRLNGCVIEFAKGKSLEVLLYLLLHPTVEKEQMCADFMDMQTQIVPSSDSIRALMIGVNRHLGFDLLMASNNLFLLDKTVAQVICDVMVFKHDAQQVFENPNLKHLSDHAIDIYHHALFVESSTRWVLALRQQLASEWGSLLKLRASQYYEEGNSINAIRLCLQVLRYTPLREDVTELLMTIYCEQDEIDLARLSFKQLQSAWQANGQSYYPSLTMQTLIEMCL